MSTPVLRMIADDLTGALDSAAEFAGLCGRVPVRWDSAGEGSFALDSGTREATRADAVARLAAMAPALRGASIAFKKIDSLWRGHAAAELAACMGDGWRSVVLAPAFPAQGRITRGLTQMARTAEGGWRAVADLLPLLAAEGLQPQVGRPDATLPAGLVVFDAESEADLLQIAAIGRAAPGPVLWCGSGGLAGALAAAAPVAPDTRLARPVLGLFGSDQAVTARQLAACGGLCVRLADDVDGALRRGAALVHPGLPPGLPRAEAAARIASGFGTLVARLPAPGTLIVAGGETLRALCDALGATALVATGLVAPGVPRSVLRGGRWDGVPVISKSGAFGGDALWRDLLASNGITAEHSST
jgi:uncharacterized protein YgbK (DUF1537 family)